MRPLSPQAKAIRDELLAEAQEICADGGGNIYSRQIKALAEATAIHLAELEEGIYAAGWIAKWLETPDGQAQLQQLKRELGES